MARVSRPSRNHKLNKVYKDGDVICISLRPLFFVTVGNDSDDNIVEYSYCQLPKQVQAELASYFQSLYFIVNVVERYVLDEVKVNYDSYPICNVRVTGVKLTSDGTDLYLEIKAILVETIDTTAKYRQLDSKNLLELALDGFVKASNDGPLITSYGQYLGDHPGGYQVAFNKEDIHLCDY